MLRYRLFDSTVGAACVRDQRLVETGLLRVLVVGLVAVRLELEHVTRVLVIALVLQKGHGKSVYALFGK